MVHHKFILAGETVNVAFYVQILKRYHVQRVRPKLWVKKNWITVMCPRMRDSLCMNLSSKNNIITMNYPAYSFDLAHFDSFLFLKVKMIMRGEYFGNVENMKRRNS